MKLLRFKLVILLLISSIIGVVCNQNGYTWQESILFSWIGFGILYVIESVLVMVLIPYNTITKHAKEEDLGVWLQFILLIIVCATALITLISWNSGKQGSMHIAVFAISILLSWIILHLSFAFRYAHVYYGDENESYSKHARGLDFPHESHPDYLDFAYYSFTIGMTFQVSDVTTKTRGMRRLTLVHSLISFFYNTILIAITINEVVNLGNS